MTTEEIIMIGVVANTTTQIMWFMIYLSYRYQDNKDGYLSKIAFNSFNTAKNTWKTKR